MCAQNGAKSRIVSNIAVNSFQSSDGAHWSELSAHGSGELITVKPLSEAKNAANAAAHFWVRCCISGCPLLHFAGLALGPAQRYMQGRTQRTHQDAIA
jgi:hypothetical protein